MGSCPVCLKNLMEEYAEAPKPILTKEQKRRQTLFPNTTKRPLGGPFANKTVLIVPEDQIVVSTKCGHLFHKLCLRDYIITFRQITRQNFVECPICQERIILSSTLVVHLRSNEGCTEKTDKELKHAQIMHRELTGQVEDVQKKIAVVDADMQAAMITLESLQIQQGNIHDQWSTKQSILKEFSDATRSIDKCKEEWEVMRTENIELASIYLSMVIDHGKNYVYSERVPKLLRPHLKAIKDGRSLLKKFLQILAPLRPTRDRNGNLEPMPKEEELVLEILKTIRTTNPDLPDPEPEPEPEPDMRYERFNQEDEEFETCAESEVFEESQSFEEFQICEEESQMDEEFLLSEPSIDFEQGQEKKHADIANESAEHPPVKEPCSNVVQRHMNNCIPGVQTNISVIRISDNMHGSSAELEESLNLGKQRKHRSKMTEKRNDSSTRNEARKCRNNLSANTIIISPGKDYSKLVKLKKSETPEDENMSELFRRSEFNRTESDHEDEEILGEDESDPKLDVVDQYDPEDTPSEVLSCTVLKLKSRSTLQSPPGIDQDVSEEELAPASSQTFDPPVNEKIAEQTVSKWSQMSSDHIPLIQPIGTPMPTLKPTTEEIKDHSAYGSEPDHEIPMDNKVSAFFANPRSLPEPRVPTFKFSNPEPRVPTFKFSNPDPRVPTFRFSDPDSVDFSSPVKSATNSIKVPSFKAGTEKESNLSSSNSSKTSSRRSSVVPYSSSSSSSSDESSSSQYFTAKPKMTQSSGFEINHLSIVDYFGRRRNPRFSLESSPSRSNLGSPAELGGDFNGNALEDSDQGIDDKIPGFSTNRKESECFTPSIYSEDEFLVESEAEVSSHFRPDTPIQYVNSAYMLDLTDFPPVEELLGKIQFPASEIPPPLDEEVISVAMPIPLVTNMNTSTTPPPPPKFETNNFLVSQHIMEPNCIENREKSELQAEKCHSKNIELVQTNADDPTNQESLNLHPTFSEQLAATIVPPPPQYCLESTLRDVMSSRISFPASAKPSGCGEPPDQLINSQPSKTISIFDWLPEAPENTDKPFQPHLEIAPEVALIIQSRQAYQLRQQARRTILKVKKTRRRNV